MVVKSLLQCWNRGYFHESNLLHKSAYFKQFCFLKFKSCKLPNTSTYIQKEYICPSKVCVLAAVGAAHEKHENNYGSKITSFPVDYTGIKWTYHHPKIVFLCASGEITQLTLVS